jgi:hypothetical protein
LRWTSGIQAVSMDTEGPIRSRPLRPTRRELASPIAMLRTFALLVVLSGLIVSAKAASQSADDANRFFEAKVRPVIVEQCGKCHGPDKPKGGLRLDSRQAALDGGDSGPAIVPGNRDESLLLTAISYQDEALKMPPKGKLAPEQVADLTRWVLEGARWPGPSADAAVAPRKGPLQITDKDREHWAFQRVVRPPVPRPRDAAWVRNPIDAFILSRLEERGLHPNPPADRIALIRRVAFDLTGLPPTPEEVSGFFKDDSPDAYERMVDRYLNSPHYGERWGRHWLDLVRFAETNSYERDNPKPSAWRFRDYVVRSFNADKPYVRFVREQLAGDELPDASPETWVATGYYRLGIWDDEPTDQELARFDGLDDIVTTTGQVFLGMTIDCARCHDHKLDPIPQRDYYSFLAFFRNINPFRNGGSTDERPLFESPSAEADYKARLADLTRRRDETQDRIAAIEREFASRKTAREARSIPRDIEDLSYRFYRDTWDKLPDFDGLKYEETGELPGGLLDLGPRSRDDSFGFVFEGALVVPADGTYTFSLDSDDGSRLLLGGEERLAYDGVHTRGNERAASVELKAGRVPLRVEYFQWRSEFGLDLSWAGPGFARRLLSVGEEKREGRVAVAMSMATEGAQVLGTERFAEYERLKKRRETLRRETVSVETALVVTEAGPKAADTFILARGNPHVRGDKVEPAFLEVLGSAGPVASTPSPDARTTGRRTVLADWIASPENPLTARVMVNRVWQHHLGRGIVRSPSNFGLQGDRPTHPELLDWLAAELVESGWRLKHLHRLILTSNAYRMSSAPNDEAARADPTNDLFWRFDMRRLSAEELRDAVLAVSGDLSTRMHGPGVYPEIPTEVLAGQSVPGKGWGKSSPEEQARRSVYVHVKRSLLLPILAGFDAAETDRSTPMRFSTTQPTQALTLLNSAFLNRQAARFADRLRRDGGDDPRSQVARAWDLATGRSPTEVEVDRALAFMADMRSRGGLSAEASLRVFSLLVLNLNEFVYLD